MSSPFKQQYVYNGWCHRVIDGDTIEVEIDLGFNVFHRVRVRLINVNAAELFTGSVENRKRGVEAKNIMEQLVLNKTLILRTEKDATSFNRYLGEIWLHEDSLQSVNEIVQPIYETKNLTRP